MDHAQSFFCGITTPRVLDVNTFNGVYPLGGPGTVRSASIIVTIPDALNLQRGSSVEETCNFRFCQ
jgi:hypothetical protein